MSPYRTDRIRQFSTEGVEPSLLIPVSATFDAVAYVSACFQADDSVARKAIPLTSARETLGGSEQYAAVLVGQSPSQACALNDEIGHAGALRIWQRIFLGESGFWCGFDSKNCTTADSDVALNDIRAFGGFSRCGFRQVPVTTTDVVGQAFVAGHIDGFEAIIVFAGDFQAFIPDR